MGRFETELLSTNDNLATLANLSGVWIDAVHRRKPLKSPLTKSVFSAA
jgi:hypothetical protein